MAKTIVFLKEDTINGRKYKKGDELKVHDDTANSKIDSKIAKLFKKGKLDGNKNI